MEQVAARRFAPREDSSRELHLAYNFGHRRVAMLAQYRVEFAARNVLAASSEGDSLRTNLAMLRRFVKYDPVDAIAMRRAIARRLLASERYVA